MTDNKVELLLMELVETVSEVNSEQFRLAIDRAQKGTQLSIAEIKKELLWARSPDFCQFVQYELLERNEKISELELKLLQENRLLKLLSISYMLLLHVDATQFVHDCWKDYKNRSY